MIVNVHGTVTFSACSSPEGTATRNLRSTKAAAEAFAITATAAFQPKTATMKLLLQFHVCATISTGGAAKDERVPPIDTLTKTTPRAKYLGGSGMSCRNA